MAQADLTVDLGPLKLKNPVMPASGTYGWVKEFEPFYSPSELGAIIPKTVTLQPRSGNRPQRIVETPSGMLNSIGLQNPGFDVFASDYWPVIRKYDTVRIVNIAGESSAEFIELARKAASLEGADAVELNTSCPNVNRKGEIFGTGSERIQELVAAVKKEISLPVIVKLTPNVTDICQIARAAEDGGADILSLTNTLLGMAIDVDKRVPVLDNIRGGLSGPAIKPVSLRMVYDVSTAVSIPCIGIGGISTGIDAVEFLMAGASAVQVGTANFTDPMACFRIIGEIRSFLDEKGCSSVRDIIQTAHLNG